MEVRINGQSADIRADNEKTVGQFLANFEMWLSEQGHSFSGLAVDGEKMSAKSMEDAFSRELDTVKTLDIFTSSLSDLLLESLENLAEDINEWDALAAGAKNNFIDKWRNTAQARLLSEKSPDLYGICARVFSLGDMDASALRSIVQERIRETACPGDEFKAIENLVNDTCDRLVDLPLDIQTAKDARTAKTIEVFTAVYEKTLRLYKLLSIQGDLNKSEDTVINDRLKEFGGFLKEFLDAYERHDTILIGDLAEYEIAVRLKELYQLILKNIN